MHLPVSGIDTPSPCDLECLGSLARCRTVLLLTSSPVALCRPVAVGPSSASPAFRTTGIPPHQFTGLPVISAPHRWRRRKGPLYRTVESGCWSMEWGVGWGWGYGD